MNIVERAKAFRESLCTLLKHGEWDWQQCPHCGSRATIKNGSYQREPWGEHGREQRRMQRHLCHTCQKTYTELSPELIPRSWYTRAVHRKVLDMQEHLDTSLRRAIEWMRAEIGHRDAICSGIPARRSRQTRHAVI